MLQLFVSLSNGRGRVRSTIQCGRHPVLSPASRFLVKVTPTVSEIQYAPLLPLQNVDACFHIDADPPTSGDESPHDVLP